jgi:3-dehydroquinate synthase
VPIVTVSLADRSYPIVIEPGSLSRVGAFMAEYARPHGVLVVSNPAIAEQYGELVLASLQAVGIPACMALVPPGDRAKSLRNAERLIDRAVAERLDRTSAVLALGGGVIGDLAGFVAAIYLRGVSFIQVPTSLLAQVDASVGGKTAVNHRAGKNLVGCFHQPRLVVIDPCVLETLPRREVGAGLAEMVKHGVILDASYFIRLESGMRRLRALDQDELTEAIAGSCALKASVVAADEREAGRRALLNYGHTFGHALETVTCYRRYKHGEAVALGMEMAAMLSQDLGLLSHEDALRQRELLRAAGLPVAVKRASHITVDGLLAAMEHDKKVVRGRLRFVLAKRIGAGFVADDIPVDAVRSVCRRFLESER